MALYLPFPRLEDSPARMLIRQSGLEQGTVCFLSASPRLRVKIPPPPKPLCASASLRLCVTNRSFSFLPCGNTPRKWCNHSGAPRDLCMCSAGTSRRRKDIDAGKSMGKQWNVERISNANERIHAGLQLERPPEAVSGGPLDAVADAEAADPVLNIRKDHT